MKKTLALLLALVMVLSSFTGCSSETPADTSTEAVTTDPASTKEADTTKSADVTTEAPQTTEAPEPSGNEKDTLILVGNLAPITMDPYGSSLNNKMITGQIFDSLLGRDENGDLAPNLAESWEESEDGTYITYHLKHGVKFHDGSDFNADCVVFSVDTLLASPDMGWGSTYVQKAEKVDEYTVNIYKATAFSALGEFLAQYLYVVNPDAYTNGDPAKNPIGTGPFKFNNWGNDDYIYMDANEDYHRGAPYYKHLIIRTPLDPSAAIVALQNGEVDLIATDVSQAPLLQDDPNIEVHITDGWSAETIIMMGEDYMNDQNLRRAIFYAVNRDNAALFSDMPEGYVVAKNMLSRRLMGVYDGFMDIGGYDPELAKEYLAKSNYDGRELPIVIQEANKNVAQSVQADLEAIGIKTKIEQKDANSYSEGFVTGVSGIYFSSWGCDYASVEDQLTYHAGHGFYGKFLYNNEEYDNALIEAGKIYTQEGRAEYTKKALTLAWEFANMVPMYESMFMYANRADLTGFKDVWAANFMFELYKIRPAQ